MNKKQLLVVVSVLLVSVLIVTSVFANTPVTLCHNPGPNQVTITVDNNSVVQAHLRHGDYLGACRPVETEPPPATDVPPTDVPPTDLPPTGVPPTDLPPTGVPPTDLPTLYPTDPPKDPTATPTAGPTGVPPTAVYEKPKAPPPPPQSGLDFNWIDGSAGIKLAGKFEAFELGGGYYGDCTTQAGDQWCPDPSEMQAAFNGSWILVSFTPVGGERIWLLVDNDVQCSTAGGQNILPRHTCGWTARGQHPTVEVALPGEGALLVNQ